LLIKLHHSGLRLTFWAWTLTLILQLRPSNCCG
jgi:hypothetical protein